MGLNFVQKNQRSTALKYKSLRIRNLKLESFKLFNRSEAEFKEFEPRLKSTKTRFKLRAGLNLETFDTILSGTNHI